MLLIQIKANITSARGRLIIELFFRLQNYVCLELYVFSQTAPIKERINNKRTVAAGAATVILKYWCIRKLYFKRFGAVGFEYDDLVVAAFQKRRGNVESFLWACGVKISDDIVAVYHNKSLCNGGKAQIMPSPDGRTCCRKRVIYITKLFKLKERLRKSLPLADVTITIFESPCVRFAFAGAKAQVSPSPLIRGKVAP